MRVLAVDAANPQPHIIDQAAAALLSGAAVVFPTDTVYGVGLAALPTASPQTLYDIKQRDTNKAIPWLVSSAQALDLYATDVPQYARRLAAQFWPGALTLIVKASSAVPQAFLAQNHTIALRAPDSPVALALIVRMGVPLATSSANRQGQEPAVGFTDIDPILAARVGLGLNGGICAIKSASTIVSCVGDTPRILRPGALAPQIEAVLKKGTP